MRKFAFQLDPVLRLRVYSEQQCQRELATAQAKLAAVQAELRSIQDNISRAQDLLQQRLKSGAVDAAFLLNHSHHVQLLQQSADDAQQRVAVAQKQLAAAEQSLSAARTARKSLETLRERAHEAWLAQARDQERRELDELAIRMNQP